MTSLENTSGVLTAELAFPEVSSTSHEFVFQVHIPVFIFAVEFKVITCVHVVYSQNAIIFCHGHVGNSSNSKGNHLLKMMRLINKLLLMPEPLRLIDINDVFFFVIDHAGNVIKVRMLEEDQ